MINYLDWLEFAETEYQKALFPSEGMTKESHEADKFFWKGYLAAARDAARYTQGEDRG